MKARIVYNRKNEPRVQLYELTRDEVKILRHVDTLRSIVAGETNGALTDIAFEINLMSDEEIEEQRVRNAHMSSW